MVVTGFQYSLSDLDIRQSAVHSHRRIGQFGLGGDLPTSDVDVAISLQFPAGCGPYPGSGARSLRLKQPQS